MSNVEKLRKTIQELLADGRVKDAIPTLRAALRPELDFQHELRLHESNLQIADRDFNAGKISPQDNSRAYALATAGVHALAARLRDTDLLPPPDAERSGKQSLLNLAAEKHARLQSAHLLETDEARRFAYEKSINELAAQIAALKSELNR
jgi:hypothetical protein